MKVGVIEATSDFMYVSLFIPPWYVVSEVISQIKMRCHALIRNACISRGLLSGGKYRMWCPGYYVSTAQQRNDAEIAEYVKAALADDEHMEAVYEKHK